MLSVQLISVPENPLASCSAPRFRASLVRSRQLVPLTRFLALANNRRHAASCLGRHVVRHATLGVTSQSDWLVTAPLWPTGAYIAAQSSLHPVVLMRDYCQEFIVGCIMLMSPGQHGHDSEETFEQEISRDTVMKDVTNMV